MLLFSYKYADVEGDVEEEFEKASNDVKQNIAKLTSTINEKFERQYTNC